MSAGAQSLPRKPCGVSAGQRGRHDNPDRAGKDGPGMGRHETLQGTWPSARLVRRSMRTLTPSAAPARRSHEAKPKHLLSA